MATGDLLTTDKIQYWLKTGASTFTRVTEDSAFDPAVDLTTYDPSYKDRMNQPSYVTGKKTTVEFDIDLLEGGTLQDYLQANEDVVNVATELVRVKMYVPATTPAVGYVAKKAAFNMNVNPIDGSAGEALKATGTLAMTSDGWTSGTFDPDTATFTPDA
jgi:hypothetical protein